MDLQGLEDRPISPYAGREIFETFANSLPHMAWTADENGRFLWWNQRWYDYTGKSEAEMATLGWHSVLHPQHTERVNRSLNEAFLARKKWEDTFPIRNELGEWRWFLSRAEPVRSASGKLVTWIGTFTDITERRLSEEELKRCRQNAEAAHRLKADLLMNMSREIRAPLNTILGFASLLKDSVLSETDRQQFGERILTSGDHLLQILDDILNFSKLETGQVPVDHVPVDISEMVHDIVAAMKPVADKKDIKFQVLYRSSIPEWVSSDPLKTRQILSNLIGNAVKYTDGGGFVVISLELQRQPVLGPVLAIDVDDAGMGISREQQSKVFQPFAQLESSFNRNAGGGRLGLALSEKMAEALGGRLTLKASEVGAGSCFTFLLPTGDIKDVPMIKRKKSEPLVQKLINGFKKTKRLENVRVLLAEDSEDNETLINLYLNKEGALITHVNNGLEVLDMVKNQDFDVILMDIQMPLLDGLEATRQLRQKGFLKPILALTAHALREDAEKSLKAGCDTHINKPIKSEMLIEEIQKRVFH
jgi:PAS domain S-box-containing protein